MVTAKADEIFLCFDENICGPLTEILKGINKYRHRNTLERTSWLWSVAWTEFSVSRFVFLVSGITKATKKAANSTKRLTIYCNHMSCGRSHDPNGNASRFAMLTAAPRL
jgi:hypothetical protein